MEGTPLPSPKRGGLGNAGRCPQVPRGCLRTLSVCLWPLGRGNWGRQSSGWWAGGIPQPLTPCPPAAACTPTTSSATATWPGCRSGSASAPPSGSSPSARLQPSSAASTWPRSRRMSSAAPVRGPGRRQAPGRGHRWGHKSAPWIQPISAAWAQLCATSSIPGVGTPRGHPHPVTVTRGCKSVPSGLRALCMGSGPCAPVAPCHQAPFLGEVPPSCPSPLQSPLLPPPQDKRRGHVPSSAACPRAPARPCAPAATASWTVGARG